MFPPGGRKKALIIGICYRGTESQLNGCINDANCMKYMLTTKFGYPAKDVLFMTDDQADPLLKPTRTNIINGMRWLVGDARPGDSLFFHYSGHGGQARDRSGEEADGMNETLIPLDYRSAGQIEDDEINRVLVNPLPSGARLHAVVDACHSGTVLDLPFLWRGTGDIDHANWEDLRRRTYKGTAGGEAISFSGCLDSQTSADTTAFAKVATGAMTFAFIQSIESGRARTYKDLVISMRSLLKSGPAGGGGGGGGGGLSLGSLLGGGGGGSALTSMLLGGAYALLNRGPGGGGFTQVPQISASAPFDLNRPFSL